MINTKEIDVRFRVTSDLYNLHIIDDSCWGMAEGKPTVIEITLPGYSSPISSYFQQRDTSYDSNSLKLTCDVEACKLQELPDGIYHVKIKTSPSKYYYELDYIKLDKLSRSLDLILINGLDDDCQDCSQEFHWEARFTLENIKALVREGEIKRAQSLYKSLMKKADRKLNCKNC